LLHQADTAMYECKRTGADSVVYGAVLEALNAQRLCLLEGNATPGLLRNRIGDRVPAELRGNELVEESK
jgi:hypothetical protein